MDGFYLRAITHPEYPNFPSRRADSDSPSWGLPEPGTCGGSIPPSGATRLPLLFSYGGPPECMPIPSDHFTSIKEYAQRRYIPISRALLRRQHNSVKSIPFFIYLLKLTKSRSSIKVYEPLLKVNTLYAKEKLICQRRSRSSAPA